MREILFRGWVRDENRWIYGMVVYPRSIENETYTAIIPVVDSESYFDQIRAVDPDTVGQYTGCEDKHGKKIFEGDIVLKRIYRVKEKYRVVFYSGVFRCSYGGGSSTACHPYTLDDKQIEVVGNAYNLPEE